MGEKSLSVGAAMDPELFAALGLCAGYAFAPRKYSLKNLLEMGDDKFYRQYPEGRNIAESGKTDTALGKIIEGRKQYQQAHSNNAEEIRAKAKIWKEKFDTVEISEELKNEYAKQKNLLQTIAKENNFTSTNESYSRLIQEAIQKPEDTSVKESLRETGSRLNGIREKLAGVIDDYYNAFKNMTHAKYKKIAENPTKHLDITDAYNELESAIAKRNTYVSSKLFELTNEENLKKSYDEIKGSIPKERLKYAAIWALSLGAASALIKFIVNKTSNTAE
jgi:hypothetical protein